MTPSGSMNRTDALKLTDKLHCCHAMIMAKTEEQVDNHSAEAWIMMILREDGMFGFPGGTIEPGEALEAGLSRELEEEIGAGPDLVKVSPDQHVFATDYGHLCLHFYIIEIDEKEFKHVEKNVYDSQHFGHEVLGIVRVPVYTCHGSKGLPNFLKHKFIGNSREQLLFGLKTRLNIDTEKAALDTLKNCC